MPNSEDNTARAVEPATAAALVCAEAAGEPEKAREEPARDTRLDRLPLQLDVMIPVRSLRVEDLLALDEGAVVETEHAPSQDVPVRCGERLLAWGEFEVTEQRLAVRVTRLA